MPGTLLNKKKTNIAPSGILFVILHEYLNVFVSNQIGSDKCIWGNFDRKYHFQIKILFGNLFLFVFSFFSFDYTFIPPLYFYVPTKHFKCEMFFEISMIRLGQNEDSF